MSEPSVDPTWAVKVAEWAWAGILGLIGIVYKFNEKKHESAAATLKELNDKIDHEVRCARIEIKSKADSDDVKRALDHIEKLYANAEVDREKMRNFHDQAMQTMTQQHTDILKAMASCGMRVGQ